MPGPCCCEGTCTCDLCTDATNPCCYEVTIAGMSNGDCDDCETYNRTFLVYFWSTSPSVCVYRGWWKAWSACNILGVSLYFWFSGGNYRAEVRITSAGHSPEDHVWLKGYEDNKPDCNEFDSEELVLQIAAPTAVCDDTSATCHITAKDASKIDDCANFDCSFCEGWVSPDQIQVDFTLVGGEACCGGINGQSFILDYVVDTGDASTCLWEYEFPEGEQLCGRGLSNLRVTFRYDRRAGLAMWIVTLRLAGTSLIAQETFLREDLAFDCNNLDKTIVGFVWMGIDCNGPQSRVRLQAV